MCTFYTQLYSAHTSIQAQYTRNILTNSGSEEVPDIRNFEMKETLKQMKNGRCPGEDLITSDILKVGGNIIIHPIKLMNMYEEEGRTPMVWNNAELVLMFEKGNITKV